MTNVPGRDPLAAVRAYFDACGEGEWDRHGQSLGAVVAFELHRRFLGRFIQPGWRVLEVGAGPGRFTIELAMLGAKVVVCDISEVQLDLNAVKVRGAGQETAVEERLLLDVRDLSTFADGAFDGVIAYGGPISYAFDQAHTALAECVRVTRPEGVLLASVMSTVGSLRYFLPAVVDEIETYGADVTDAVIRTGDLRHTPSAAVHRCRMFRWREIAEMIARQPCRLMAASASNAVSLADPDALGRLAANPGWWGRFLDWEEELAQEPGALDGGTHILFAVERTGTDGSG